jgi:hypothetical protein
MPPSVCRIIAAIDNNWVGLGIGIGVIIDRYLTTNLLEATFCLMNGNHDKLHNNSKETKRSDPPNLSCSSSNFCLCFVISPVKHDPRPHNRTHKTTNTATTAIPPT